MTLVEGANAAPVSNEAEDLRILNSDDPVPDKVEEEPSPVVSEKEDKGDEDKDLSAETDEEPDEEDLKAIEELDEEETQKELEKLDSSVKRPSFKAIQKEYPDIFTKFPELREVYHRDAVVFGEIFTDVEDARSSAEKSKRLEEVDSQLTEGNFKELLSSLNEDVVISLAESIMPTLHQINPKLFYKATGPVFSDMLNSAMKRAETIKSDNLKNSVLNICEFLYGRRELPKLPSSKTKDPEVEAERARLQEERQGLHQKEYSNFQNSTNKIIEKRLSQLITAGLDPSNEMTDFMKNAIISHVVKDIGRVVGSDDQFKRSIRAMFARAEGLGFPTNSKAQIVSAYLGRVKNLIGSLRAQRKAEALGRKRTSTKSSEPRRLEPTKDGKKTSSERSVREGRLPNPREVAWDKQSDEDIIREDKVVMRS